LNKQVNFTVIESEEIFKGRVFEVHKELVLYPDGRRARIDLLVHAGAVVILPVDEQGLIWFIRQYRHPARKMLFELPAGVLEAGEEPEAAARREIREEIGMAAREMRKLGGFYLAPGYSTEYLTVFLATHLVANPLEADQDEMIQVEKVSIQDAFRMAETGQIEDAKTLASLFLARATIKGYQE
jgi:ADP-ribose pyrophosphatase